MSSPSVPDSVTCATPKAQSLSKQRSITDDKSASHPNASNQGGSSKKRKRQTKKQVKESKKEEKEKGDIVPPSTMKKTKKGLNLSHGMNAQLKAKKQGRKKGQVKVPFKCEFCHVKGKSTAAYIKHMGGLAHISRVLLLSNRVASLRQAASGENNDQTQRGNGALFAELLAIVLSKTQATLRESVGGALPADIPLLTSLPGPSSTPQLLQTQPSEVQAHVENEDPSGQTKTVLAVDAEVLAEPTSMSGSRFEPQLLQTQVSKFKAHVGMGNPSGEIETDLAVTAEVPATTSEVKQKLLPVPLRSKAKAGSSVSTKSGEGSETKQQL
ncbi:hypothetical protein ACSQ67_021031 [Phaseolus vulgaris]